MVFYHTNRKVININGYRTDICMDIKTVLSVTWSIFNSIGILYYCSSSHTIFFYLVGIPFLLILYIRVAENILPSSRTSSHKKANILSPKHIGNSLPNGDLWKINSQVIQNQDHGKWKGFSNVAQDRKIPRI